MTCSTALNITPLFVQFRLGITGLRAENMAGGKKKKKKKKAIKNLKDKMVRGGTKYVSK